MLGKRRALRLLALGAAALMLGVSGCERRFTIEIISGGAAPTSSAGVGGDATGAGSPATGGQGGCRTADDCLPAKSACALVICSAGICADVYLARGAFLSEDIPADCHHTVCDGKGNPEKTVDLGNVPTSDNPCLVGTCDMEGTPITAPASAGVACSSANGGRLCDGAGTCVQCLHDGDCATGKRCAMSVCTLASCADGLENGQETDVDCGGGTCPLCADGQRCLQDSDCTSAVCDEAGHTCVGSSCTDGHKDGDETDIDCGGSCPPCGLDKDCSVNSDCTPGFCNAEWPYRCISDHCRDSQKDADETDFDCGGSCPPCGGFSHCNDDLDCASNHCDPSRGNLCIPATCYDGIVDENETDVDCGGICDGCGVGQKCLETFDCISNACDGLTFTCVSDPCFDHRTDGDESAVDCGGATCAARCPGGQRCNVTSDCVAGFRCSTTFPHICQ